MPDTAPGIRPCPGAAALEAFALRGAADADVAAHVAACQVCRELVAEIRDNQSFLDRVAPVLAERPVADDQCTPADEIEGYELHEEIGRGGQGVVFRAVQRATRRAAAVKILPGTALTTKRDRLRFEREVEIAASLRHPNLVTVFGSGETSRGHRYVAMEHVKGVPIDRFVMARHGDSATGGRTRVDAVLRLVRAVAVGVGHAHGVGVIHRDLKPSNILVEADGTPRVLDFGLARPVGIDVNVSMTQGFVGTPAYAAPEQLGPTPWTAGTRADVYSLGLVLYRLLTGEHPYPCDGSMLEVARHARSTEPSAPSRLVGRVPQDVDTIVLKCLAKEPERRYANGAALGSDIDDYLNLRPISARRDSTAYVLRRLAMKHRTVTVGAAVLLTTVVGAAIGLAMLARDLDVTRREAVGALAASEVLRARLMVGSGASGRAEEMLWMGVASEGMTIGPGAITSDTSPMARRLWWGLMEALASNPCEIRRDIGAHVRLAGVEDDGVVWAFSARGEYREWDANGRVVHSYTPVGGQSELCGASSDRRLCVVRHASHLDLVDVARGRVVGRRGVYLRTKPSFSSAEFSPDGSLVAIGTRSVGTSVTVYDTSTFEPVHVINEPVTAAVFLPAREGSPRLAVTVRDGTRATVVVRQAPNWQIVARVPLPSYQRHFMPPVTLVPLEDEDRVLVCGVHSLLLDVDLGTGDVTKIECPATVITAARRQHEGCITLGLTTGVTAMVNAGTGTVDRRIEGTGIISSLWMSPDCSRLLIGNTEGQLRLMNLRQRPWLSQVPSTPCTQADIAVAPDGTLAWGDDQGTLHLRFSDGRSVTAKGHRAEVVGVAFSPDGEEIVTCGLDGAVLCWNRRGECTARLWQGDWAVWCVAYAGSTGRTVVAGDQRGVVRVWREANRESPFEFAASHARIPRLDVSPDGRFVAVVGYGVTSVWELASGTRAFTLKGHTNTSRAVAYSPDGRIIATAADDQSVWIWDARTGEPLRTIKGLMWGAYDLTFDPAGRVLAAVGPGKELAILDPWLGEELATFPVHVKHVFGAAFSPDGTRIYTCGQDGWIGVTNLQQISECIRGSAEYWKDRLARSTSGPGR